MIFIDCLVFFGGVLFLSRLLQASVTPMLIFILSFIVNCKDTDSSLFY